MEEENEEQNKTASEEEKERNFLCNIQFCSFIEWYGKEIRWNIQFHLKKATINFNNLFK